MTKTCKKCNVEKPLDNFRVYNGYVRSECRKCEIAAQRERYAADPEKFAAASRKWCKENPEKRNALKRSWYHKNKAKHKNTVLLRMYGLPLEEYEKLLQSQGGVCAICKEEATGNCGRKLSVDHCHITGVVRGLLCGKCNSLLGFVKDRPALLQSAQEYLSKVKLPFTCEPSVSHLQ